jgi:uridine kinase
MLQRPSLQHRLPDTVGEYADRQYGATVVRCEDPEMTAYESVSTWKAAPAPPASAARLRALDQVAGSVCAVGSTRIRVIVDGLTGAGKSTFADELAAAIRSQGRSTLRASLDDFKHPWRHAREHGYDRMTGEGYYRNPHDFASAQTLLLQPAGPSGTGTVALCAYDPLTGVDRRQVTVDAPGNACLVVDGVFGMRPEYDAYWEVRIWLRVDPATALARGIRRDTDLEGYEEAVRLHATRFAVGEQLYVDEVQPANKADIVIDNTEIDIPVVKRA